MPVSMSFESYAACLIGVLGLCGIVIFLARRG